MDANHRKEIEARVAAATAGPWVCGTSSSTETIVYGENNERVARVSRFVSDEGLANADFIAHSREDIPALLSALDAAEARANAAEERVEELEAVIRRLRVETIPLALGFIEEAFPGTAIVNTLRKETWSAKEKPADAGEVGG